jgi:ABC-type lipoprotein export system ATPase subunit
MRHASRKQKWIPVNVGEDITAPPGVARDGRIPIRSERAATVARWFGLGRKSGFGVGVSGFGSMRNAGDDASAKSSSLSDPNPDTRNPMPDSSDPNPDLSPGIVALIIGPSGAGKSTLFRKLRDDASDSRAWIDLAAISPPDVPIVDCFGDAPLRDVLLQLARVGLGEAWTYLRVPSELSEGQRWRLKLALALHAATLAASAAKSLRPPIIACDEFAAVLDRVTAMVVSRCLRRAIDADPRIAAVVATSHDDLQPALRPDWLAWCDFGRVEWRELRRE